MKSVCIALTGGMGCGKSAAAAAFASLGARVVDADKLAHKVLDESPAVREKVGAVFEGAYLPDGAADRAAIARQAFANPEKLAQLEAAIHPEVEKMWRKEAEGSGLIIVEVPLLYEKKLENKFDVCISVFCSDELRRKRLAQRGMSPAEISARDAFQMPPEDKARRADIVLFNETSIDFLKLQVAKVISRLKK